MIAKDYWNEVRYLGIEDDCPLCGLSFPMCNGLCIAHSSMNGAPGPFHFDYNDDCNECIKEAE